MTAHCSKSISADSLTGMIFCTEGIRGTLTLLNGPMGCKFYHSTTSAFLTVHPPLYLPSSDGGEKMPVDYNFLNDWFFRQRRVPCTYLDGYDYAYGTAPKVRQALEYMRDNVAFDLLAIVNSPGASLIGDQLVEVAADVLPEKPCLVLESPGYSESFDAGHDRAVRELLRQVLPAIACCNQDVFAGQGPVVNLFGMNIWQRYSEGDCLEIERLLNLCGITVNCFVGCNCTLEQISRIPQATLNVVVFPERAAETVEFIQREGLGPVYVPPQPPIGFEGTRTFMEGLCAQLGVSAAPYVAKEELARARAFNKINGVYELCGLPNGATFAIEGSPSQEAGFTRFLEDYLGMVRDRSDIMETRAELVLGDANLIGGLKARGGEFCGIEINPPTMGYVEVVPKTHLGIQGALFIVEQVLSGLMSRL